MWGVNTFYSSGYKGWYDVQRLDSDSNLQTSNSDLYYTTYAVDGEKNSCIYHYSIQEDRLEKVVQKEGKISNISVKETWIYYVNFITAAPFNLVKYNVSTGEEKVLYCSDDWLVVTVYDDYLLCHTIDGSSNDQFFVCPVDGDPYEDGVDLNSIFSEEDRSGKPQYASCYGLIVERSYDTKKEQYHIDSVRQEGAGQPLLYHSSQLLCAGSYSDLFRSVYTDSRENSQDLYLNGQKLTLSKGKMTNLLLYQKEGETQPHVITCLSDEKYQFSDFRECLLAIQGDEIIGLLTVYPYDREERVWRLFAGSITEVLFRLNPETGESSIIYGDQPYAGKVIGYNNGIVYLVKHQKVYSLSVENGKKKKLFTLQNDDSSKYIFDWQGDYLIVYCGQDLERVYKVK